MQIDVELFGQLQPDMQRRTSFTVDGPMSVKEVADQIGVNLEEVGLIVIDGVQSEADEIVSPGSRLCFFPPMTGG